jgi:hypothetical protein
MLLTHYLHNTKTFMLLQYFIIHTMTYFRQRRLPIVEGTVGTAGDCERRACDSDNALIISLFCGSTWRANFKFATVYS